MEKVWKHDVFIGKKDAEWGNIGGRFGGKTVGV